MTILISYSLTLPEDGLVGESPQVEVPVVQPRVLVHPGEVALLVLADPSLTNGGCDESSCWEGGGD